MNVPLPVPQEAEALHDLAWWAAEAERNGSDWRGVLLTVLRSLGVIESCPVCGGEPCPSPSFCQLCREADAKAAPKRREGSWSRPTPLTLIEAIKQSVRDRGIAALKEPATRERLSRCDAAALTEIDRWLQHRKRAAA
jgi:hypothetical protein